MGNSSKKTAKQPDVVEGGHSETHDDHVAPTDKADCKLKEDQSDQTNKADKTKKKGKVKKEKIKKDKKKDKKEKGASKDTTESKSSFEASVISSGTNCVDVTNFNGDTSKLSEAVTISVDIEPRSKGDMRGKENSRPLTTYEGRVARSASPTGPGVSALREKFGGKATGTPSRPVSFPASRFQGETPKASELHQPVHRKPFGYNRAEETPQRNNGDGRPDGNVSALKQKFGGASPGDSPATPSTKQTAQLASPTAKTAPIPSKYGGVASRWQATQDSTPKDTITKPKNNVDSTFTPTTTKTTTGLGALKNRWKNNADDGVSSKAAVQLNRNPEKKRRVEEEQNRVQEQVKKENEKNRSPLKKRSPSKELNTPSRDGSPTKDASPRKRKSAVLKKFGGITKGKAKQEVSTEKQDSSVVRRTNVGKKSDQTEKDQARQTILNRTSALIHSTPNTKTVSRLQFEETVPKRTRREDSPKERPKTDYTFPNMHTPRPKSVADTKEIFSSPGNLGNTPVGGTNIIKNPTTKTQKLLQWCQIHTQGYPGVSVSNFSSSWADGLAFCALVHKFHPTAFNFNSLTASNRRRNLDLAFASAETFSKVPLLLDTEDMLEMGDKPDWKCVFTYVTSLYAGLTKHGK